MALSKTLRTLGIAFAVSGLLGGCKVTSCDCDDDDDDGQDRVTAKGGEAGEVEEPSKGGAEQGEGGAAGALAGQAGEPEEEGGAPPAQGGKQGAGGRPAQGGSGQGGAAQGGAEGGAAPEEGGAAPAEGGSAGELGVAGAPPVGPTTVCEYSGDESPTDSDWTKLANSTYESEATVSVEDGLLHLTDDSTVGGSRLMWGSDCFGEFEAGSTYVAEFRVRGVDASDYAGFLLTFGDTTNSVELTVFPDAVMIHGGSGCDADTVDVNLAEEVHVIQIALTPAESGASTASISVDGEAIASDVAPCAETVREITFGLGSASATAEGYVDQIRAWKE